MPYPTGRGELTTEAEHGRLDKASCGSGSAARPIVKEGCKLERRESELSVCRKDTGGALAASTEARAQAQPYPLLTATAHPAHLAILLSGHAGRTEMTTLTHHRSRWARLLG